MAASHSPAPESIIHVPQTLPTYSTLKDSSYSIPINAQKQYAIKRNFQFIMLKFNPVPFVPSKTLDLSKHENMMKTLGLWGFAHLEFDKGVRVDLIAELIASYDPKLECSYVNGTRITVNRAHLARAMKLHLKKSNVVELDLKKDSMEFIVDFLLNWVLLHGDKCFLPVEVLNWVKVIRDRHPEKLDWAGLLWFMVENELSQGVNLQDCYYASHLQLLIKSQCEDVLLKGEAEKMELDELREEMKKRDEKIVSLERELCVNRNLVECYGEALSEMQENVEVYKETLEEMHNVVVECKKMYWLPEESLEESETLVKCSKKNLEINEEAICKDDESQSQKQKKFLGVYNASPSSWKSEISSSKLKSKNIYLGTFASAEEAARAHDAANLYINGSKAILNFPNSSSSITAHLPPSDTVMSIETIKKVAASAANKICRYRKKLHGIYKLNRGPWRARIRSEKLNKRIYLGSFPSEEAAARAHDAANLYMNGSKAILNFPIEYSIPYLPSWDTDDKSIETIKKVAASASKNTFVLENAVTNNGEVKLEQE